mmetsp:Transcript_20259/g.30383  ORF Transcript_20259/g.30383 Transcript_20259/m.30383 type:complete len:500 (-) Transcript_20259:1183-2682(-)
MMNIDVSSTSTQSSNEMDGRNASIRPPSPHAGDKRRPGRKESQHASTEAIRKHAVTALATSISRPEHLTALTVGLRAFNHSDESVHDEEIDSVADAALCRLLSFLLFKEFSIDKLDSEERLNCLPEEILRNCQLFELIYGCSKEKITASFQRVGPDLLRLLCHIIMYEIERYALNPELSHPPDSKSRGGLDSGAQQDTCLQSATRILFLYARVQSLTEAMAQHKKLLSLCITLIKYPIDVVPFEAQHNVLFILANMACCRSCVLTLSSYDSLMDTVAYAADQNRVTTATEKTSWAEYYQPLRFNCTAFRCLLNLSHPKENKITMVGKDGLLRSIAYVIGLQTSQWVGIPQTLNDMATQTRRFAMSTLRNIASAPPEQKYRLCSFKNGILLDALCTAAQDDHDPVAKEKSFAVIFNLVCSNTVEILTMHPQLLELLVDAVASSHPRHPHVSQGGKHSKVELSEMPYQSLVSLSHVAHYLSYAARIRLENALSIVKATRGM